MKYVLDPQKMVQKVVVKNLTSLLHKIGKKVTVKYLTLLHSDNSSSPLVSQIFFGAFPNKITTFWHIPDKIQQRFSFQLKN